MTASIGNSKLFHSVSEFYDSPKSQGIGYFPIVGTPIGIGRIVFNAYRLIAEPSSDETLRDRCIVQIVRGVFEAFSLGVVLAGFDFFCLGVLMAIDHLFLQQLSVMPPLTP